MDRGDDCGGAKAGNENAKSGSSAKNRRKGRIELRHESVTWRNDSMVYFCVWMFALAVCRFERRPRTEKPLAGGLTAAAAKPPTGGFTSSYPTAPAVKPAGNPHGRPLDGTPACAPDASPPLPEGNGSAAPGGASSTPLVKKNLPSMGTIMMRTLSESFSATIF